MNFRAATWWERFARALRPLTERLTKLSSPRPAPVKVPVRAEKTGRRSKSSWWAHSALLLLSVASCGGPNDPVQDTSDPGANDPEVTSFSPTSGPAEGGTLVTLTGLGLENSGSTEVLFGSASATGVAVISDTTILCNAPAGTAG
ncbi:MAG: IPT/TIG domain-containing protein, partial [Planctomycetes bacterium]|nr:IPT/TIG domain-containing protein [Planctomycetota bacterium]